MKTRFFIIIGIVIISTIIFGVLIMIDSELRPFKEHYQIEITGLKETYLVGEPYSFSFILSGYGYSCGGMSITWPINKTNNLNVGWIPGCTQSLQSDFVYDEKKEHGRTYGNIALKEDGNYTVSVQFERGIDGPTVAKKSFLVVDTIPTNYDNSSDEQLRGILYHCKQKELLVDGSIITEDGKIMKSEGSFSEYFNGTHYIDNNICKWQERK